MADPVAPLIVYEGGDLFLFRSVASAERGLEVIDVRAGIYRGFDAAGRALRIEAHDNIHRDGTSVMSGQVSVNLAEDHVAHPLDLRDALLAYLDGVGQHTGNQELHRSRMDNESTERLLHVIARYASCE